MKFLPLIVICVAVIFGCFKPQKPSIQELITPFEEKENYSATYSETIEYYKMLQQYFSKNILIEVAGERVMQVNQFTR